jgi:urease accessory protein
MAGFQASPVFGTLVICCDNQANAALAQAIDNWQTTLDSSQIKLGISQKPGVLIARALATRAETARETFIRLWHLLRPEILSRPACSPRIWNT